ncbi:MAG: hypothetical protein SCJ97_04070 [Bacillota bacterium]|nr:hypothetical protein [Bacillota bacterium]
MRIIFIFIDGIGLGEENENNPFSYCTTPGISKLLNGKQLVEATVGFQGSIASLFGLDALLNVPGAPQSATGQASIFTGVNAAKFLGRHLNGFPNDRLRKLLALKGIYSRIKINGYKPNFINAYRPQFFDLLNKGLPGNRYSCSTLISYYGGLHFHSLNDILNGRALYMDITNEVLNRMGFNLPLLTPDEAAFRLAGISKSYDFSLFEYFLSDLAGHLGDREEAARVVSVLDRFIVNLADQINYEDTLIVVASDHGNLEDISTKGHTLNMVPALIIGNESVRQLLEASLVSLTDLFPAFCKILEL